MPGNSELVATINIIEKEKGIDKEALFEAIESSLLSACKKNYGTSENIRANIDRITGEIKVLAQKTVVETVENEPLEISLADAKEISVDYELGDIVEVVVTPREFGRVSAQTAKQVVVQKLREAERNKVISEFTDRELKLLSGVVERIERRNVYISSGKSELVLLPVEQIPGEEYFHNQRVKVVVLDVREGNRSGPVISVSRTHPELVARLFEQEVPEVADGTVQIRAVAREAGFRSKIAVSTTNENVDPVGSCVGTNGMRVNIIVGELNGEKIDIINYSSDPKEFIAAALSPAVVLAVRIEDGGKMAKIVVPDNQLSLAIGREGQNARLAAKLTGYRIDIKSYSKALEENSLKDSDYLGAEPEETAGSVSVAEYAEAAAEFYEYSTEEEYYEDDEHYDDEYDDEYDDYDDYDEYDDEYYDDEYEDEYEGDENQQE